MSRNTAKTCPKSATGSGPAAKRSMMPAQPILVLNSGSSSIKFSMWEDAADPLEKLL